MKKVPKDKYHAARDYIRRLATKYTGRESKFKAALCTLWETWYAPFQSLGPEPMSNYISLDANDAVCGCPTLAKGGRDSLPYPAADADLQLRVMQSKAIPDTINEVNLKNWKPFVTACIKLQKEADRLWPERLDKYQVHRSWSNL